MGDLEQVDVRQVVLEQRRVDALLDIAHQQEASLPDLAEKDDRDVVDAGPAVGRLGRDLAADRP
jgi:predicted transcriptional regulator